MKNKLLPAVALVAAMSSGCQKEPQVRAEYGSDPKAGCTVFVRESVERTVDLKPGEPYRDEVVKLDTELRRRTYELCLRHHEVTGNYPGMK